MKQQNYAVVFDFDGTLADTVEAIREGVNRALRDLGLKERTHAEVLSFVGNGARELMRRAIGEEKNGDAERIDRALRIYEKHYNECYLMTDRTYDGVRELIERLHAEGFAVGVLSNKQDVFVKQLCKQVLTKGTYQVAQGVGEGDPTKPDPYLSNKVAAMLGKTADRCIMVGDSDVDVRTAQNAGMEHIGVTWGFRSEEFLRESGARRLAHTPEELYRLIHEIQDTAERQ